MYTQTLKKCSRRRSAFARWFWVYNPVWDDVWGYNPVQDARSDFEHGVVSPQWCQTTPHLKESSYMRP